MLSLNILKEFIMTEFQKFTIEIRDFRQNFGKVDGMLTTVDNKKYCMDTSNAQWQGDVYNLRTDMV